MVWFCGVKLLGPRKKVDTRCVANVALALDPGSVWPEY